MRARTTGHQQLGDGASAHNIARHLSDLYKARKSRYIGTQQARLQAAWTATLVNLNPIGRHLATQTA